MSYHEIMTGCILLIVALCINMSKHKRLLALQH